MNDSLIRKAAVVVASLQPREADALLERFPTEQAQRVRLAVMDLGEVDQQEQQQILREFFGKSPEEISSRNTASEQPTRRQHSSWDIPGQDPGVELALSSNSADQESAASAPRDQPVVREHLDQEDDGLLDLDSVPGSALAQLLTGEHPQTVALIMAHLSPQQAVATLQEFPMALRTDVLQRVARLSRPHPEIVREVGRAIHARVARRDASDAIDDVGLAALQAILEAADRGQRRQLVHQLVDADAQLATHLEPHPPGTVPKQRPVDDGDFLNPTVDAARVNSPPAVEADEPVEHLTGTEAIDFSSLEQLSDEDLARVLHAADPDVTVIALTGASHAFVQRILAHLPIRQAAQLQTQMEQIGPLRLDDVEQAQRRLAQLAVKLLSTKPPEPVPGQRFAVAA